METKHTKGEWHVNPRALLNVKCGEMTIASCSSSQNGDKLEEERANAKLIAASPLLLEALMQVISDDPTFLEIPIVQNAIKKATE